ncbi:hypothetical protein [His2 virus]|uniref:Uncharacterized protein n=1 Tax=His 2 virus TaxID=128710 RepID=Q25BF7_HIS2V|nr:hypothetical protein His2V_gp03 [His2 virus]AAQ13765.1 hypothetical protein [His2 virus]
MAHCCYKPTRMTKKQISEQDLEGITYELVTLCTNCGTVHQRRKAEQHTY